MKINIFCGSKNRFQVLSDILTRKKGVVIEYSDRPAANAVNIGFACSQELVGLQRASCVTAYEGGYIVEGTELFFEVSELLGVVSLLENGQTPECGVKKAVFNRYYQSFDDCSFGFSRCADGFDLELQLLVLGNRPRLA